MWMLNFFATTNPCAGPKLFDIIPSWYEFLPSSNATGSCQPALTSLSDIWLIVAAVIEILLRIATLAAIAFVIVGGVSFITSQGSPDKTAKARSTIINALVGLIIAISASLLVGFMAVSF
jgi:FtsH-binding integral membrane protein